MKETLKCNRISELDFPVENVLDVRLERKESVLEALAVELGADLLKPAKERLSCEAQG